jgi:hypothetical protein
LPSYVMAFQLIACLYSLLNHQQLDCSHSEQVCAYQPSVSR